MPPFATPGGSPTKRTVRPSGSSSSLSRPQTPQLLKRPASSASMRSPTPNNMRRPGTPSSNNGASSYSGNIKVSIRVKPEEDSITPSNPRNSMVGSNNTGWDIDPVKNSIASKELGEFTFDKVFHGPVSNEQVYTHSVRELVDKVMAGFHATVFAYGMTGSGKTFSMQGTNNNPGIIPLSVYSIYDHIKQTERERSYNVKVAYLEIYNEHLNDLLNPSTPSDEIRIRDSSTASGNSNRLIRAVGLKEVAVESPEQLLETIAQGDQIRRTEGTDFNARSSRSHAVVQINIESTPKSAGPRGVGLKHNSTLYLCDLAGSERAVSHSERRKEGAYINKSLLTLGTVIARLSSGGGGGHIPYRDSKLTRLLQPALSGKSLVSVLCTLQTSGATAAYMETVSTLRFAARAKNVIVNVKRNEELANDPKTVERLMQQVEAQKLEIQQLRSSSGSSSTSSSAAFSSPASSASSATSSPPPDSNNNSEKMNQLEAENKILNERVEHLTRLCDDSRLEEVLGFSADDYGSSSDNDSDTGVNRRQNQRIDEYKSYISHLEKQLYQQELSHKTNNNNSSLSGSVESASSSSQHYADIIQDLKDEIEELRESNQDKDRIISALRSVNRRKENLASFNTASNSSLNTTTSTPNHSSAYTRYYFSTPTAANNNMPIAATTTSSPRSLSYSDSADDEDLTITTNGNGEENDDASSSLSPMKA